MMQTILGKTESLCPICLQGVPAVRIADGENVYLEKTCREHGSYRALIWKGAANFLAWGQGSRPPAKTHQQPGTRVGRGCPNDCGLCPEHEQDTCSAVIEVVRRCNLGCPVCFAASTSEHDQPPSIEALRAVLDHLLVAAGRVPIQLSGGEPTLRDDLPEIVALASSLGFPHIQLNTNGIRIGRDKEYLRGLKNAGLSAVFLQWDGLDDAVYRAVRGADLLQMKRSALDNCAELHLGVILVPTLVPGVNTDQIGGIVQFAKAWMPTVRGVHFQPISYFGRYPHAPEDENRFTIPQLLECLESQTEGEVCRSDFAASEPRYCSFSGLFVLEADGRLRGISASVGPGMAGGEDDLSPAERTRRYIARKWRYAEHEAEGCCGCQSTSESPFYSRARAYSLSISGMAFQDVWNVDIERLRRCCIHVATLDGGLVPLCAYYLTGTNGCRIYPREGSSSRPALVPPVSDAAAPTAT